MRNVKWRDALCIFAAVGFSCSLAGCATDPDDREFFNSGWLRPEAGAEARIGESGRASQTHGAALTPNAPPVRREPVF
jgi:hypothetical protein